ncbi:MAG: LacI family DNA-binding transcriptional regulator [Actinobacteria bacterium]|nr:LacI family DNA-binding transcriptional regulator [Actinomycetota bacterium]
MKVNMQAVARRAGVSSATVSRVLRGLPNVRQETRKKVLKVVKELKYEVNAIARSLAARETKTIGLVVTDVKGRFNAIITEAVEEIAIQHNYNVIICNNMENPKKELRYLKTIESNRIDGIILMPTQRNIPYIKRLLKDNRKIVLIDRLIKGIKCDSVLVDNEIGAYKAVKFLVDNGYRKIATIAGIKGTTTGLERLNGYLRALKEANIEIDDGFIKYGDYQIASGIRLSKELLEARKKPEAIFTANIQILKGLLIILNEKGIKIPDDIGVITFDDIEWPECMFPKITAVRQSVSDIGRIAAELLFKKLDKKNINVNKKQNIIRLKTDLIIRNSTKKLR